ncbi:MAG: DUF3078 domain-containing protein [Cyclobacteriaceae bacterium]|nr:DUF3078 domain-containing protein [Cyclobacteriaceae bacterium]
MRLSCCILLILLSSATALQAQVVKVDSTTNWRRAFKAGLNLNQANFSSNWKAGGVNSFGFTAFLNYKANYKTEIHSWDNELDFMYGMVNNAGQGYRKTLDRIFLDTKYGRKLGNHWDLFLAMNFQSQFASGYKYTKDANGADIKNLISDFLAPGFLTTTIGFEYKPSPVFKLRISPFAPRITFVRNSELYTAVDPVSPYGVAIPNTVRYEWLAAQLFADFNKDIAKNINLKWRYILFANYEQLDLKRIDHRLDINLTAKVNRFVNVNIGGIVLYDFDQDNAVQLSQAFSLGVLYTFQNYADK